MECWSIGMCGTREISITPLLQYSKDVLNERILGFFAVNNICERIW